MENPLVAIFENAGLISEGKPVVKNIRKATVSRVDDLCKQTMEISSHEAIEERDSSIFSLAASPSLGGDCTPCSAVGCRLNKVKELTQFAALYSDKVYVNNFFYKNTDACPANSNEKEELKRAFEADLMVFCALLPLIEAGRVQMVAFGTGLCPHCLSIASLQEHAKEEYEKACTALLKRYYKEVSYSIEYEFDEFALIANGPEELIPHGSLVHTFQDTTQAPKLTKRAMRDHIIKLTTAEAKEIKAGDKFSDVLLYDIAFELGAADLLNTSFLADNELTISFLRNLTSDPLARRRTALMQKYLTCIVPFIQYVDTRSLIQLREREEEAFILFRAALTKAVEEYKTSGDSLSARDAQAIYADIIQPRLTALDAKIINARNSLRKYGVRKLIGWTGAISIGIYSGLITANPLLAGGAAVLGAAGIGANIIETLMAQSDAEDTIRTDDLYFLWKVKALAKVSKLPHQ